MAEHSGTFEDYFYPGTQTLINLPGFRDPHALRAFEYERSTLRAAELLIGVRSTPRSFDLPHLQAIHWTLLRDVYSWAGRPRTCNIQKDKVVFADTGDIELLMDRAAEIARAGPARPEEPRSVAQWVAEVYLPVNYAHPFREGNGRSTKMLLHQLLEGTDYTLNLAAIAPARWNWLAEVETRHYALNGTPHGRLADELAARLIARPEPTDSTPVAAATVAARYLTEIHRRDPVARAGPDAVLTPQEYDVVTANWAKTIAHAHPDALTDPHWPVLARQLDRLQRSGTDIAPLLADSAGRPLQSSRPARELDLRISAAVVPPPRTSAQRPTPASPVVPAAVTRRNTVGHQF